MPACGKTAQPHRSMQMTQGGADRNRGFDGKICPGSREEVSMSDDGYQAHPPTCGCALCNNAWALGNDGAQLSNVDERLAASTGDYRIDALLFPSVSRWNIIAPLGTPVAVSYSFLNSPNDP